VAENEEKAVELYMSAIEKGDTPSKVRLGICYHRGEGVERDERKALSLFEQAGAEDQAYALHNLGYYHEYGRGGIAIDVEKAIAYYRRAADEGSRVSITTLKERHGVEYTPPSFKYNGFHDEEEALMILHPDCRDDCLSASEMEKVQQQLGHFFSSSSAPANQPNEVEVRPLAARLLHSLESAEQTHPLEGMDAAIVQMLTAAAGLKSADLNTQKKVESAITALIQSLPSLLEVCKHNQAVLAAVQEEMAHRRDSQEEEREEKELALSRARVVEVMLHHPSSSFSSRHFLDNMREKVQSQLSQLKEDLARAKRESEAERKAETGAQGNDSTPSGRDYLLELQKRGVKISKVTLPLLVDMSRKLEVDLLSLSDGDLEAALEVKDLEQPVATSSDILRFLRSEVDKIEKNEDPSTRISSTQSLSSFLSGSLPDEGSMEVHATMASAAAHLVKHTRSCASSSWQCELEKCWSSLEVIWSSWSELEGRIEKALSDKETSWDTLRSLLTELDHSSLLHDGLRDRLASQLHALTVAATAPPPRRF